MPINQKDPESIKRGSKEIARLITSALENKAGLLVGRHGTVEFEAMMLLMESSISKNWNIWETLEKNAGVFHKGTVEERALSINEWYLEYMDASIHTDCIACGWYEPIAKMEYRFIESYNSSAVQIPLRSLEPYYVDSADRWTNAIEGCNVCVVSSFTETIKKQLEIDSKKIWSDDVIPRNVNWSFVRSYYAPSVAKGTAEWSPEIQGWADALNYMEEKVVATGCSVALIGCGGLALPLGHRLKKRGIVAIIMGGAIQVLFGIKGARWKNHGVIGKFWNDNWVSPSADEIPGSYMSIEGGCYW